MNNYKKSNVFVFILFSCIILTGVLIFFFIGWVIQNIIKIVIGFIFLMLILYWLIHKRRKKEDERRLEQMRINEMMERKRLEQLKKEEKELINRVLRAIYSFKPFKKYGIEILYQTELGGYLKHQFPSTKIETQSGSSRPDIIIDNIAIEVKAPTTSDSLKTIPDKCVRYHQHFSKIIVIMFEIQVGDRLYNELREGLKVKFPEVTLIKKH